MKVLVPVDGSIHSEEVIKVAIDFARFKGAEIYVLSVAPNIGGMDEHEISPAYRERTVRELEKRAEEIVRKACDLMSAEKVLSSCAKSVVTSVSVPDAICDFAESEHVDLILMGSRGLDSSHRFKLGSVATQVVKAAPCSIYLVKTPSTP
jgi:nucleotide-binding universal stress UspA family protein